jgi:hypothetical protein
MTTQPDPAEAVPTNNSAGAPVDENRVEEVTKADAEQPEDDPET